MKLNDLRITNAIVGAYAELFCENVESDVLITGAGPAGLVAARCLANRGVRVVVVEKRLSTGGGIWGGGMLMNRVIVQEEAVEILDDFGVRHRPAKDAEKLHVVDSVELASALTLRALQAGATILNGVSVEDVRMADGRVNGLVVNWTPIKQIELHVDPLTLGARAVIDATGHEAVVVNLVQRRNLKLRTPSGQMIGEQPMNADEGETFVVEHTGEVFPGLYVTGMAVCASFGGSRMGPIFGGMLLSGRKVALQVAKGL